MGEQARPHNIRRTLEAIGATLESMGMKTKTAEALKRFDSEVQQFLKEKVTA